MKKTKDDHTVEWVPIDYYCLGETQREIIKERQAAGITTPYDAKDSSEEAQGKVAEKRLGFIRFV